MSSEPAELPSTPHRRLIPVTQWNKHHAWPPIGGLRYLVFHEDSNGFSYCVRRVGRKVLIDEARFFEWVDRVNGEGKSDPLKWSQLELLK